MGRVYEARDIELNRRVAIKFSLPHLDPDILRREARVMAAFHHPGLVAVYTSGTWYGLSYAVMELLTGHSLAEYTRQNALSAREIRDILFAIAESLAVLHEANLVHRDLKPANIMIMPPRRPVLVDFGTCDMNRYISGTGITGSPHYLAPEMITQTITASQAHLIDIYSLGAIGYLLLTGEHPHDAGSLDELLVRVVHDDARPIATVYPQVCPPLAELIMELVARDAAARPQSIELVAARLRTMHIDDAASPALQRRSGAGARQVHRCA